MSQVCLQSTEKSTLENIKDTSHSLATYRNPLWHGEFRIFSSKYGDIVTFFQKSSLIACCSGFTFVIKMQKIAPKEKHSSQELLRFNIFWQKKYWDECDLTEGFNILSPKTKGPNAEIGILKTLSCENWHLCHEPSENKIEYILRALSNMELKELEKNQDEYYLIFSNSIFKKWQILNGKRHLCPLKELNCLASFPQNTLQNRENS